MRNQRGVIHLVAPLLILVIVGVLGLVLFSTGIIKNPFSKVPFLGNLSQSAPKVALKTEYKNPFDKKTQFVNPFDEYKNPFVVNR